MRLLEDRRRTGRVLLIVGAVGIVAASMAGAFGWVLTDSASTALSTTLDPIGDIVGDVGETIEASQVMVTRTNSAIESIESATRSTARTLISVGNVIEESTALAGGGLADGLESAVDTLPGLIDTSRVIDRTMRALSLVGVTYDPDMPLDESLADLEASLRPLPRQIREQTELIQTVQGDLSDIAEDAGGLAAVLLEVRIDMMDAEAILESASANVERALVSFEAIERDVASYRTLGRIVVVAGSLALLAAAATPLVIGLHYTRSERVVNP